MSQPDTYSRDDAAAIAKKLGLLPREFDTIVRALSRVPNPTEIAVFSGMWSEHCAYKSTKHLLRTLPKDGQGILAGPGSHAGVVDVGEGWGVAFKIESHNHPSAVDPYQGATTGVGGILRDIIAQGARPCAIMDSLCFGMPDKGRNSHLADGVVAGVAGYGNAIGVPNVGGKTVYDKRYEGNPLVNAMGAGLVRHDAMYTAAARGEGNLLIYVGAATGRDGVLGAAFASEELADDNVESRPHVQVGDPFAGKKLMEACLAITHDLGVIACQDMGACGITCATMEMAAAGDVGLDVHLDAIPLRETGMTPQEILLSESQERFMFVVDRVCEQQVLEHFARYSVHACVCGTVTQTGRVRIAFKGETYVNLPAHLVAGGAPPTEWPVAVQLPPITPYPDFARQPTQPMLMRLLADPNVADPSALFNHYDQTVGNRTVRGPGAASAAVLKLPESQRGFALALSGRGEVCGADPYLGAQAALADVCRDLACVGAPLLAITDGLNMSSPRDPVEMLKLVEVVRGLREGLKALGVPVTGGNVSLYNESPAGPICPSPMVGALGTIADIRRVPRNTAVQGDALMLVGLPLDKPVFSHFARLVTDINTGAPPAVDLEKEMVLAAFLIEAVTSKWIHMARPVGLGGLGVGLAKICAQSQVGVDAHLAGLLARADWALFGEYPAMAWISSNEANAGKLAALAETRGIPLQHVGTLGGQRLRLRLDTSVELDIPVTTLVQAWSPKGHKHP